jgi:pimeloyl-ACP methyl ester carboxylesterase
MKANERTIQANGVELAYETFGERSHPPLLLAHGAGDSMLSWREALCERLAMGGRFVVRYDSRDAGRSTSYEPGDPPYSFRDTVADAAALIDALELGPVHFAGLSNGGAVGQLLALDYPEKVATLTLLSTTPGDPSSESPDLSKPDSRLAAVFSASEPDWADRDAVVEYLVEMERPFAGSHGFGEEAQRELCGQVFDRTINLAAQLNNPFALEGEGWRGRLGEIIAPTLVIHGDEDPMFPLDHGQALAREIPGAELLVLEGVGHEYPPPDTWDTVAHAILRHTS